MFEYEQECLEVFLENQEQLLGRKEMETLEDADAFLSDCMAVCDLFMFDSCLTHSGFPQVCAGLLKLHFT